MAEINQCFMGRVAIVDLTSGRVTMESLDRDLAEDYIGGQGIASRLAYDLIPEGADPLGPQNVVVFSAGPFLNSMVPGASKLLISTKSPINNRYASSSSGIFADQLKAAGFDHVVVKGVAPRPVYLHITDNKITIENATAIWGKDTYDATEWLWAKHPRASVITIGTAGENLVPFSIVLGNKFSTSGSGGTGAVLGSKKLKALVAEGTQSVRVAEPGKFMGLSNQVIKDVMNGPYTMWWRELGTLIQLQEFAGPGGPERSAGMSLDIKSWTSIFRNKLKDKSITCPGCPVACKQQIHIPEGPHQGDVIPMSCSIGTLTVPFVTPRGAAIPLERYDEAAKCAELINRVGISATSSTFQWAVDLYEKGVLTKADTGGLDLRRGNYQAVQELIRQIGSKEGFGAVVGQTFDKVQADLSPKLAGYRDYRGHFLDKTEEGVPYGDKRWTVLFFGTVVDPRGDGPGTAYGSPTWMPGRSASSLKRYGERIGISDQELNRAFTGQRDGYDTARLTHAVELYNIVLYSLGLCQRAFISRALPLDRIADLYTVGTGIKVTPEALQEKAERIITVQRLFNVREGWTKDKEVYPRGYLSPENERELQRVLTDYYRLHNWDPNTGAPTEDAMVSLNVAPAGQGARL